ncbi:MAG: cytochrome P450 [Gaiellales bacterium]
MPELIDQAVVDEVENTERMLRFPVGATLELADLDEAAREPSLDRLRSAEPVSWIPALQGWLVTGHAAARELLTPRTGMTVEVNENLVRASLGHMMLSSDADDHTRQRAPFERPFRMRAVESLFADTIATELDRLFDELEGRGSCELGVEFAAPYAVRMTGRVLGLSLDEVERIDGFYSAFAGAMVYDGNPEPQRLADAARTELNEILHGELARTRRKPDASLTAEIANDGAVRLSDDEVVAQLRVVMFGGIETIQSAVMNTMLLLLRHPDALAAARTDPVVLANAIEESLRLIPPVAFVERWTAQPTAIGGIELRPGEFVGASIIAANRDPALFTDPLRYDVTRENARRHLSFSFGEHHCLGSHLARLEILAAVQALLERLPGLELGAHDEPSGFAFRRPGRLELRWDGPRVG